MPSLATKKTFNQTVIMLSQHTLRQAIKNRKARRQLIALITPHIDIAIPAMPTTLSKIISSYYADNNMLYLLRALAH